MGSTHPNSEIQRFLADALAAHHPCIVPPGGDRWLALVVDGPLRVVITRVDSAAVDPIGSALTAIDVSLSSENIDYDRLEDGTVDESEFTYGEQDEQAWDVHVESNLAAWTAAIGDAVAAPTGVAP
jgi:hypothetical protein